MHRHEDFLGFGRVQTVAKSDKSVAKSDETVTKSDAAKNPSLLRQESGRVQLYAAKDSRKCRTDTDRLKIIGLSGYYGSSVG
jgi:hypothetical protein